MNTSWYPWISGLVGIIGLVIPIAGIGISLVYLRLSSRLSIVCGGFVVMLILRIPQLLGQQLMLARGVNGMLTLNILLQLLNYITWAVVLGGLAFTFSELQRRLAMPATSGVPDAPNQPYDGYRPF